MNFQSSDFFAVDHCEAKLWGRDLSSKNKAGDVNEILLNEYIARNERWFVLRFYCKVVLNPIAAIWHHMTSMSMCILYHAHLGFSVTTRGVSRYIAAMGHPGGGRNDHISAWSQGELILFILLKFTRKKWLTMDWFKGKSTENHPFSHSIYWVFR